MYFWKIIFSPDDDILEEEEQVGQLSGQTEHVGKNFGPGEQIGQLSEHIGQLSDQIGQLSGQDGQVGQFSNQPEQVTYVTGQFSKQGGQEQVGQQDMLEFSEKI